MAELPLAPFKRIVKGVGVERVSEAAVEELRNDVEDYAEEQALGAKRMMEHAGRKTVQAEDVRQRD